MRTAILTISLVILLLSPSIEAKEKETEPVRPFGLAIRYRDKEECCDGEIRTIKKGTTLRLEIPLPEGFCLMNSESRTLFSRSNELSLFDSAGREWEIEGRTLEGLSGYFKPNGVQREIVIIQTPEIPQQGTRWLHVKGTLSFWGTTEYITTRKLISLEKGTELTTEDGGLKWTLDQIVPKTDKKEEKMLLIYRMEQDFPDRQHKISFYGKDQQGNIQWNEKHKIQFDEGSSRRNKFWYLFKIPHSTTELGIEIIYNKNFVRTVIPIDLKIGLSGSIPDPPEPSTK